MGEQKSLQNVVGIGKETHRPPDTRGEGREVERSSEEKGTLQPSKQDGGKSIPGQGAPSTKAQKHHTPEGPGNLQQLLVDRVWGSQAVMLERRRP